MGMVTVLEVARRLSLRRVAWASSVGVYSPPLRGSVRDDTPPNPPNLYGALKALNERQTDLYHTSYGVDVVGVRFVHSFGPGRLRGWQDPTELLRHAALGIRYRMPALYTGVPWIYVGDQADSLVAVLRWPKALGRLLYNLPGDVRPVEDRVALIEKLVPGAPLELEPGSAPPWDYRAEALEKEIGWRPQHTLETGFRTTINGFRDEAGLPPI
jgi:nucleoside-diphosphate-sugar epimerase